jgi:hypothetical protein
VRVCRSFKDPSDPAWDTDAGVQEWRAFMKKYGPTAFAPIKSMQLIKFDGKGGVRFGDVLSK